MQVAIGNMASMSAVCGPRAFHVHSLRRVCHFQAGKRWVQPTPGDQSSQPSSSSVSFNFRACSSQISENVAAVSQKFGNTWSFGNSLALMGGGGFALTGAAALAEEIMVDTTTVGGGQTATDRLISVLFIAVFIALCILTVGVIYFSVVEFQEKREREAMKKAAGPDLDERETTYADGKGPKGFGKKNGEKQKK